MREPGAVTLSHLPLVLRMVVQLLGATGYRYTSFMYAVQGDTACRLPRLHPSFEAHATYGRELPVFICRPAFPCWPAGVIVMPGAISLAATRFGTIAIRLKSHRARKMRLVRLIALGALALGVASAPAITHDLDLDHALQHDQHNGHSSSCYHSDTSKGIVVLTKCRRTTTHRSKTRSSSSTSCPRATTTTAPPNSTTTGPATTTTTASVDMCDKGGECDCSCIPDVNSEEYGLLLRYQSLPRQRTDSRARSRDGGEH